MLKLLKDEPGRVRVPKYIVYRFSLCESPELIYENLSRPKRLQRPCWTFEAYGG